MIYIYVKNPVGSLWVAGKTRVWANQEHVSDLGFGCYFPFVTAPGDKDFKYIGLGTGLVHVLQKKMDFSCNTLNAEAGKTYYIKVDFNDKNLFSKKKPGVLIPEEKALKELEKYALSKARIRKEKSMVARAVF